MVVFLITDLRGRAVDVCGICQARGLYGSVQYGWRPVELDEDQEKIFEAAPLAASKMMLAAICAKESGIAK